MTDCFEGEYLRCDECGQYYPKSYLKRCKVCGRIICGRCIPYHSEQHRKVGHKLSMSDIRRTVRPFINPIFNLFGKILSFGFGYAKTLGIIMILGFLILGVFTLGSSVVYDDSVLPEISFLKSTPNPHIVLDDTYSGMTYKTLYFDWRGKQYPVSAQVESSIYMGSKKSTSHIFPGEYETYYVQKTTDILQDAFYEDVLDDLENIRYSQNLDSDEYVELITAFVQSIPYDEYAPDDARYPITVFFDGTGDCDEKSMLLCGLLARAGYDVVLFDLPKAKHMSAAIRADGTVGYTDGYVYIETTNSWLIGEVPDSDGDELDTNPEYYKIGNGYMQYTSYDEVEKILDYREKLELFLDSWQVDQYSHTEVNKYNQFVDVYNSVWDINNAGERERLYSLVINNPLQRGF